MCGLAGYLFGSTGRSISPDDAPAVLQAMGDAIAHRGPDASGTWHDSKGLIGLVHRRLSIIDISLTGAQPMHDPTDRYVLAFNGEIYNHKDIRRKLEEESRAFQWRGSSDTETLLAAVSAWGFETALQNLIGMFAIALWDKAESRLFMARDRFGEKPLYYGWVRNSFIFASELKALHAFPDFQPELDPSSVFGYLEAGYVSDPACIWKGLAKLAPGTWVEVTGEMRGQMPQPRPYWSHDDMVVQGRAEPFSGPPDQAIEELDRHLREAVERQMISDVPLGAFLSGGIDSSVVVSLMSALQSEAVSTFSIGFEDEAFNEAPYAAAVAKHLGTRHTSKTVTALEALSLIPELPDLYDEPFGDSSSIPTHFVAKLAANDVKVVLSGDAGDETFHGYSRYFRTRQRWELMKRIPTPLRQGMGGAVMAVAPTLKTPPKGIARAAMRLRNSGYYMVSRDRRDFYGRSICHWPHAYQSVAPGNSALEDQGYIADMAQLDMVRYLPGDILTKVDRAAMATSLETRVPMLDHTLQHFAATLPDDLKVRDGVGKWILREVLHRYVPKALFDRPKKGFGVPLEQWLRGDLKDWACALMQKDRLETVGLEPEPFLSSWQVFQRHGLGSPHAFWTVLMLLAWHEKVTRRL